MEDHYSQIRPLKSLGQHFLTDEEIAEKIASSCLPSPDDILFEIGPGKGMLTKHLLKHFSQTIVLTEVDTRSVEYLKNAFPPHSFKLLEEDFLQISIARQFDSKQVYICGNFPYNISSQILFKIFEQRDLVSGMCGMFQREVARRVCSGPGNKEYGILSVLIQAFYKSEYLFTVDEGVFHPPPKVKSGVMRITRLEQPRIQIRTDWFKTVVKAGFNQRRKTLKNALSALYRAQEQHSYLSRRAETLSPEEWSELTIWLSERGAFGNSK